MNIPIFETKRLILREPSEADVPSYEEHFIDYEVIGHLNDTVPWPYPKGGVLEYLQTQILPYQGYDRWIWGIFLKQFPEELIGGIELRRKGEPDNRGFWLAKKYWGRGIMTEAVIPVLECAFNELGFEKLIFSNAVGNKRSHRIKEKTGARLLYIEPAKFVNPDYTEREVWELSKDKWKIFKNIA
jgi:[ribosomal protein S5]-alanine N-acetyltransferase